MTISSNWAGNSVTGVEGVECVAVLGLGDKRWEGKSFGGGLVKKIVRWFNRALRVLFNCVRI